MAKKIGILIALIVTSVVALYLVYQLQQEVEKSQDITTLMDPRAFPAIEAIQARYGQIEPFGIAACIALAILLAATKGIKAIVVSLILVAIGGVFLFTTNTFNQIVEDAKTKAGPLEGEKAQLMQEGATPSTERIDVIDQELETVYFGTTEDGINGMLGISVMLAGAYFALVIGIAVFIAIPILMSLRSKS